jgi:hypothetical protein
MKKWLVILGLLLAYPINSQRILNMYDNVPYVEFHLLQEVSRDYLGPDVTVYYIHSTPLHPFIYGITHKINHRTYMIQLNGLQEDEMSRVRTLLHEMGHVIDGYQGRLTYDPITWDGETYPMMDWADRPWEKSANVWSDCLFYEYVVEPELKRQGLIPTAGPRIKF